MRIKQRYQALSPTVKASFWFVVCNVIQKATQILTTPIYTRILSQEAYGEYTAFLSWIELAAILTTLDIFYSGYNVGMERFKNDRDNYTTAMHGLCFALTTIWVVLGFIIAPFISPHIEMPIFQIRMLLLYMYIFPIFQFWSARKKYDYQYKPLIIATALISLFSIVLGTVFAYSFDNKSNGVIISKIIVEFVVAIPLICFSVKGVKNLYHKYYWKYALRFNIPLIPHYMSTMVLNHSDRLMIVSLCNKADAAIYSVAYSIAMLMTIVQNAINSAIVPWMYRRLSEKKYHGMPKVSLAAIGFIASLNIGLLIIAPEAIKLISTSEYTSAMYVIPPITFGVFLTGIYGFFVNIELYYHFNKFVAFASVIAAISNIVLNYVFIPKYGYIVAGYTTLVSYLLLTVMHYCGIKFVLKREQIACRDILNMKYIILVILAFGLLSFAILSLYGQLLIRYGIFTIVLSCIVLNSKRIVKCLKTLLE